MNPDLRVFAFAFTVVLLSSALFGAAPALRACRSDANQGLKGTAASDSGPRWAMRDLLLVAQVAVCCLLVTATFVAFRGLKRSLETPLGFEPAGAAVVGYDLGLASYTEEAGRRFHQRALEAVSQIPGVTASAFASSVPLSIDQSNIGVYPEWITDFRPKNSIRATYYRVSPGFFRSMGTKMIAGREFTERDAVGSSPLVAIVNETFARSALGPGEWVGRRFRYGPRNGPLRRVH